MVLAGVGSAEGEGQEGEVSARQAAHVVMPARNGLPQVQGGVLLEVGSFRNKILEERESKAYEYRVSS